MWFPLPARKSGSVTAHDDTRRDNPEHIRAGPLVNEEGPRWKSTTALGCSPGAITRRGNVAAYATIDYQNARNRGHDE